MGNARKGEGSSIALVSPVLAETGPTVSKKCVTAPCPLVGQGHHQVPKPAPQQLRLHVEGEVCVVGDEALQQARDLRIVLAARTVDAQPVEADRLLSVCDAELQAVDLAFRCPGALLNSNPSGGGRIPTRLKGITLQAQA